MKLIENIKKSFRFLLEKENADYSFGCVMIKVNIPETKWEEIQSHINDEDIYEGDKFGREDDPHITLLYGVHNDLSDKEVEKIYSEFSPIEITLDKVDIFEGDDYDVVKFNVQDKTLSKYNKELRDNLDYTNDYPDYKAHLTIAYVKSGEGKRIAKELNGKLKELDFKCNEIEYGKANKEKIIYKLK